MNIHVRSLLLGLHAQVVRWALTRKLVAQRNFPWESVFAHISCMSF